MGKGIIIDLSFSEEIELGRFISDIAKEEGATITLCYPYNKGYQIFFKTTKTKNSFLKKLENNIPKTENQIEIIFEDITKYFCMDYYLEFYNLN